MLTRLMVDSRVRCFGQQKTPKRSLRGRRSSIFDGPRSSGGNDHEAAHSLRDANRDRKPDKRGDETHRVKTQESGSMQYYTESRTRQPTRGRAFLTTALDFTSTGAI